MIAKKCKDTVYDLLTTEGFEDCKNNDLLLIKEVWRIQSEMDWGFDNMTVGTLFGLLQNKKISSPEAIRRCRAKTQEIYPETRGSVYLKRHNLQAEVIDDLDTMVAESRGPSLF